MTCFDFQNRVHELLDRRQRELPNELAAHMTHCVACHDDWQHLLRLHDAAAIRRASLPSPLLADRVLEQLRNESGSQTFETARFAISPRPNVSPYRDVPLTRLAALLLSALTLLMAVGIGWKISSNVEFAKRQNSSANAVAVAATVSSEFVNDRQLDVLLHDAREAYVALASQAWQQVSAVDLLLPPANVAVPFNGDAATQGISEPLSRPLAPFGAELRDAVDSLFHQVFNSQDSAT